jgi:hypothetical protein
MNRLVVNNYGNCDLVTVERHAGFDMWVHVYKASTHELVGAYHATDTTRYTCGSSRVSSLEAGIFPAEQCTGVATLPCTADAGTDRDAFADNDSPTADRTPDTSTDVDPRDDADVTPPPDTSPIDADATTSADGDGSTCGCTLSTMPGPDPFLPYPGLTSLPCFCGQSACPTYDVAITQCPVPFPGSTNRLILNRYATCNRVSVERHWGLDLSVYVYDATTFELVGAYYATDTDSFTCGPHRIFALQAGVFPIAGDGGSLDGDAGQLTSCPVTQTTICSGDGGSSDAQSD